MTYPKAHRKAGTKKKNVPHAKLLTGSSCIPQLEAREAVTYKKSLMKAYQAKNEETQTQTDTYK